MICVFSLLGMRVNYKEILYQKVCFSTRDEAGDWTCFPSLITYYIYRESLLVLEARVMCWGKEDGADLHDPLGIGSEQKIDHRNCCSWG